MITSATRPLLLEIGCEEIPARFLTQAQKDLGDRLTSELTEHRLVASDYFALSPGEREGAPGSALADRSRGPGEGVRQDQSRIQTYSTPRRLVAYVPAVLERQADKVEEITGPPIKVAVDATGKYTRAAESFAQKNSATVADLTRITTPKGEYLAVKKTTPGRTASEVLSEILPGVITGLGFPKSMYWTGKSGPRFVRPIRWVLAVLGEGNNARVVPFEVAGVKASSFTFGHRTMGRKPLQVSGFKDYLRKLHQSKVELEPQKRREWLQLGLHYLPRTKNLEVINEVTRALRAPFEGTDPDQRLEELRARVKVLPEVSDMRVVEDKSLEEWVVNSTEWPRALLGTFEEKFLKLPREILVTVMRDHQKYFAVEDAQGNLRPHFVASLNREGDPQGLIKRGHERVLTARFSDAEFFWNADQKVTLAERFEQGWLERVTYQAKLGNYGEKVQRMDRLAGAISSVLINQGRINEDARVAALRATQLCKCDLMTQMVQEFTELQGVVGGLYAQKQGEPEIVASAIYDHYKPQGIEESCPRSMVGAVVALADKIDAVASGFVAGLAPTGSSDPFGLRRQANGAIRILLSLSISINLKPLVLATIDALSKHDPSLYIHTAKAKSLADEVVDFFRERVASYLEAVEGLKYDVVRASLAARGPENVWYALRDDPVNIAARARDCSEVKVRHEEAFLRLSSASKRIRNILTKSAEGATLLGDQFKTEFFVMEEERVLAQALADVGERARQLAAGRSFASALQIVAELSHPVDRFFDSVMVMAEDLKLRENRLRLLNHLNGIFSGIIDFSQIVVDGVFNSETSETRPIAN